jgi:hypothetical protein
MNLILEHVYVNLFIQIHCLICNINPLNLCRLGLKQKMYYQLQTSTAIENNNK